MAGSDDTRGDLPGIPAPSQKPFGLSNLVQPPRPDANPGPPRGRRQPGGRAETALNATAGGRTGQQASSEPTPGPTREIPVSEEQRALEAALSGYHDDATADAESGPEGAHDAITEHEPKRPEWGEDAQARAERERPLNFGDSPVPIHEHGGSHDGGRTHVQSGAAVAEQQEAAATEAQSGDAAAPGDVLDVNVQEQDGTAAMGSMAATMNMARWGEPVEWRPKAGWRPDPRFGEVLTAAQSEGPLGRLMTAARALRAQLDALPSEDAALVAGLASGEEHTRAAGMALALHIDQEHQEHWWLYTNLGPGTLPPGVRAPKWAGLGYEHARVDPQIQALMIGHADPVVSALHHYSWFAKGWAEHRERHALIGVVSTLPVSAEAARFGQKANDHLKGEHTADAPLIAQAEGVGEAPALERSAHPLELLDPDLHTAIRRVLQSWREGEVKALAAQWIARAVEHSTAQGRPSFTKITSAIRNQEPITPGMIREAHHDAGVIAVTMRQMLARGMEQPENMGLTRFGPFLSGHNAQLAALALHCWEHGQNPQNSHDHDWVFDVAYLAAKTTGNGSWIAQTLPDPDQSPYKPRQQ